MEVKMKYLIFAPKVVNKKVQYQIWNTKHEHLGMICKLRVGQWMSWCLFLNEGCYMSAGCLDEVREKIRSLNSDKIKAMNKNVAQD
jgi:hypothetical protein